MKTHNRVSQRSIKPSGFTVAPVLHSTNPSPLPLVSLRRNRLDLSGQLMGMSSVQPSVFTYNSKDKHNQLFSTDSCLASVLFSLFLCCCFFYSPLASREEKLRDTWGLRIWYWSGLLNWPWRQSKYMHCLQNCPRCRPTKEPYGSL